ncbi:glycosyltransferase family 4 protein [Aequorivita xiaoshiensis]|uniref:Glycosyltransferase family 4 protein n=1 Tax=Aequorivita xiaoshiensis TaxID=2874476 RepID=A0A9X1UDL3_9FLAO|nr:glycosyltransferase family 4 protein [Aequorivita xiaoshiensis]MCG2431686.1 glycosyltransferase family 4 protein [Aequorivita xiaoshiensis]
MPYPKLIRITTVPISLEKLLEGQLEFMQDYFEVTAISADKEKLYALGEKNNYHTYYIEMTRKITPWQDLKAVVKLYKYLKKESPAIVHTHTPKAGIVGMLAAWLAGVPNRLHTVAGLPLMEAEGVKRIILNLVEKLTYRFASKVYPNSKGLYDFILKENFSNPSKLAIIGNGSSNGIDTEYFNPNLYAEKDKIDLRNQLGIPQENFVFIFVGRLVKDKGINELVEAFTKLLTRHDNLSLLLVGPLESDLDPLSADTLSFVENTPQIISVGYQNDVRSYFAIANALTFPSYREGFPNVVMQAGAMGLPSIVSDINGCNEIVDQNVNGLIVPPKSAEELYLAMQLLISDAELFSNLKSDARRNIVVNYSRKEIWEALLKEYKNCLNNIS